MDCQMSFPFVCLLIYLSFLLSFIYPISVWEWCLFRPRWPCTLETCFGIRHCDLGGLLGSGGWGGLFWVVFLDAVVGMVHRGLGVWVNLARFVWCDADRCLGYCLCCAADWWMFWLCTAVHGGLRGQENNGWPCSSVVVLESSHLTHHSGSVNFCKLLCWELKMLVLLYYLDWNALHGLSGADCDGLRLGGGVDQEKTHCQTIF